LAFMESELAAERERSAGYRADYERERDRADRLVAALENLHRVMEAARPVTSRPWWRRWRRSAG
jgi:hypothetical protein